MFFPDVFFKIIVFYYDCRFVEYVFEEVVCIGITRHPELVSGSL